ncbi:ATP-dependent DNA helicase PIF1-like [Hydra vulgaris]|uniref:ATP-dependent DNA helicase n=1 Tax=Hydra vulgaris TaxID=6087 RepID=A0ABM4CLC1_HYDVU
MHPDIKKTWLETDVLIIDEISMINASTFDLLHSIACEIRQYYDELFGGVQVIACGDFFQLPPVSGQFVFKSQIWQHYMTEVFVLTQCFRQKDDEQFFGALNELRVGQVSDKTIDYFMTRCFEKDENLNSKYTRLFFRNIEVDVYNNQKMETIKQKGATVMLVRNINVEEGLCNGTIGTIILIESNAVWVMMNKKEVKIECVKEKILDCSHAVVGSRFGLPLKLAFSFTVHKAQGSTMKKAVVQFNSKAFINSLYYVSLSRVYRYKDEDIGEESQLYSETQSPDEIVNHVEQKTMKGFETQMKNSILFGDLFQNFLLGCSIVTLCCKSIENGYCNIMKRCYNSPIT